MVNSTAQPLTYAKQCSTTTSDPFAALLHMPDDIKEWVGVEEEAIAFSARIPDSAPIYKGWSPSSVKPSHELTALDCMDSTFFKLANQLAALAGLPPSISPPTRKASGSKVRVVHRRLHMHVAMFALVGCIMQGTAWSRYSDACL